VEAAVRETAGGLRRVRCSSMTVEMWSRLGTEAEKIG
jgi:hypothetical protein